MRLGFPRSLPPLPGCCCAPLWQWAREAHARGLLFHPLTPNPLDGMGLPAALPLRLLCRVCYGPLSFLSTASLIPPTSLPPLMAVAATPHHFVSVSFPFRFHFVACLADWPGGCCAREIARGLGPRACFYSPKTVKKREEKKKGGVCHAERDEDGAMKMGRNGTRTRRVRVPSTSRNEPLAPRRPDLPGEYLTGWIGIKVMV